MRGPKLTGFSKSQLLEFLRKAKGRPPWASERSGDGRTPLHVFSRGSRMAVDWHFDPSKLQGHFLVCKKSKTPTTNTPSSKVTASLREKPTHPQPPTQKRTVLDTATTSPWPPHWPCGWRPCRQCRRCPRLGEKRLRVGSPHSVPCSNHGNFQRGNLKRQRSCGCGSKPTKPLVNSKNRRQMDVHPPQNGAIGYAPWPCQFSDVCWFTIGLVWVSVLALKCPVVRMELGSAEIVWLRSGSNL